MLVLVGAVGLGLAYWAWTRGARWTFLAGIVGFLPGSVTGMGVYRDTLRQLSDILVDMFGESQA